MTSIDSEALGRMLQCETCKVMAEICMKNSGNTTTGKELIDPVVERILSTYMEVFQEPSCYVRGVVIMQ